MSGAAPRTRPAPWAVAVLGMFFGFSLSRIGFSEWGEVHRMFALADLRLLFTFAAALAVTMSLFAVLNRGRPVVIKGVHRGTVLGGVLFGAGWAIAGTCPTIVLVQLGEGQVSAVITGAGILLGTVLYHRVLGPALGWKIDSCG